eukprot:796001-Prymnesium_polylepis.1
MPASTIGYPVAPTCPAAQKGGSGSASEGWQPARVGSTCGAWQQADGVQVAALEGSAEGVGGLPPQLSPLERAELQVC